MIACIPMGIVSLNRTGNIQSLKHTIEIFYCIMLIESVSHEAYATSNIYLLCNYIFFL